MKKTKGTIDRFEGDFAVILLDSAAVNIPRSILPEDAKEGEIIYISITDNQEEAENQQALARNILNEVLKEE